MKQFCLMCLYRNQIKFLKWSKKMTRWHKHLKFPIKICRFSEILFNNYAELYAKITVYEGIQCKVTKLRSIQINFNPLMSDGNKRSYMLLKQTCSFKYVLPFLPPGIKWLTGLHKCLKFAVHTCIDFKELRHMHVLRHFVFERVSSLQISSFFPWERPFFAIFTTYLPLIPIRHT